LEVKKEEEPERIFHQEEKPLRVKPKAILLTQSEIESTIQKMTEPLLIIRMYMTLKVTESMTMSQGDKTLMIMRSASEKMRKRPQSIRTTSELILMSFSDIFTTKRLKV